MKHIHNIIITLVVLASAVSCATKSDIDNLQGQVDEMRTGKIATIEQQISNIQASIASLQATDGQLSEFISAASSVKTELAEKEKALSDRIDELKIYIDNELSSAKDWASATFATLEQYQAVLNELAEIKESIKTLDKDLRKELEDAINASESSMKGWVNEQLAGYYTIAQMDAKLKALADADAANEQAIGKVASDLESAKTELTEAYTKAITDAITKYNGEITARIAADIKTATDALQKLIDALDERVAALEGMIQSVVIIPDYSDGSIHTSKHGILTLNCIINPANAVKGLTKENIKLYVANTVTKAPAFSLIEPSDVVVDENTGIVTIVEDISSLLSDEVENYLSVAVNVKKDNVDCTSKFSIVTGCNYSAIPFTITSIGNTSVSIVKYGTPNEVNLDYRIGKGAWSTYTIGEEIDLEDGEYVQFKNKSTGHLSTSGGYYGFEVKGTGSVTASGNIMSLLDSEIKNIELNQNEFCGFFLGCKALVDASNLILPSITLADYCYNEMFAYCIRLKSAPELPATTLARRCYGSMFSGCSSLSSAPELPALSLAAFCYYQMFAGCHDLIDAPELPATILAEWCYHSMFYNCSSLESAPKLPATTLAYRCYDQMFFSCGSLTVAPELPATTLASECYLAMFSRCKSLTTAPQLPATILADYCYSLMFEECWSLTTAPDLPATTLVNKCYREMFSGCRNLNSVNAMFTTYTSTSLTDWLDGVSSTGTFVKSKDATWNNDEVVPAGWTVVTE